MSFAAAQGPDHASDKPPRRPRWLPISLQIFVGTLLLSFGGGLLGMKILDYRRQGAVREIERVGGVIRWEKEVPEWIPFWIEEQFPAAFFHTTSVDLSKSEITDDSLYLIGRLTDAEELDLTDTAVSDAGLRRIATLTNLKSLSLRNTRITDAGLKHLATLRKLTELDLCDTHLTGEGFAQLTGFTELLIVQMRGSQINGVGLRHLVQLPNLWVLFLDETAISDAELTHLTGPTRLRYIGLRKTLVTEAGIQQLHATRPNLFIYGPFGDVWTPDADLTSVHGLNFF